MLVPSVRFSSLVNIFFGIRGGRRCGGGESCVLDVCGNTYIQINFCQIIELLKDLFSSFVNSSLYYIKLGTSV